MPSWNHNIRAVEEREGMFEGLISVQARENPSCSIDGILVPFQFDKATDEVALSEDEAFFYGKLSQLLGKYHTEVSGEEANEQERFVTRYKDRVQTSLPLPKSDAEGVGCTLVLVPILDVGMRKSQTRLYEEAVLRIQSRLPNWVRDLEKVEISSPGDAGKMLHRLPAAFTQAAIEQKEFYKGKKSSSQPYRPVSMPPAKIRYTPFGGIPAWAKPARHR